MKHSELGIAGFVVSLVVLVAYFGLLFVGMYHEISTPGGLNEYSWTAVWIGLCLVLAILINIAGLGLAIGGLWQKERQKIYAILGVIFNAAQLLVILALIFMGA